MKIVSYNLRAGGKTGPGNHWQRLFEDFAPDIICAQESLHPSQYIGANDLTGPKYCVHEFVSHGKWGSAILSKTYPLEAVRLPEFKGSVVGARIHNLPLDGQSQSVMVFSVHAPTSRSYVAVVNQILDEINKVRGKEPLILAGDFNVTTAFRHPNETEIKESKGARELLTRLRTKFGLLNAWQTLHPNQNLPQTLRWAAKPSAPYHCDAIFVSHHFLPRIVTARVEDSGDWAVLSDHNPVIADIA